MEEQPNNYQDPSQQQSYSPQQPQLTWEQVIRNHMTVTKGWIKFLGIFFIIYAGLVTLVTLGIGIIVAWIPFLLGLFLLNASNRLNSFLATDSQADLADYYKQLKNYFMTTGILIIVGLGLSVIMIIVTIAVGASHGFNYYKGFNF